MNKKLLTLLFIMLFGLWVVPLQAQFRNQPTKPNISSVLINPQASLFSGFLNPNKLRMHHTVSMSFGNWAGQSMMLSSYLNTIDCQISEKFWIRANIGIMSSPYNTFGQQFYLNKPRLFGGAQLNYQISDKSKITVEFNSSPFYRPMIGEFSAFDY